MVRSGIGRIVPDIILGESKCYNWAMRRGFTLIELLLAIGIIAIIAGIVVVALSPRKNFISAYDSERQHSSKQIAQAVYAHLVDQWELVGGGAIQEGEGNAKVICKPTTSSADCASMNGIDMSELPPKYITSMPVDPAEPEGSLCTGYKIYQEQGRPFVNSAHMGIMSGEGTSTCCVSGGTPFSVCTCADLQSVKDNLALSYIAGSSIDCSEYGVFAPIAGEFNGTFDGDNNTISNITIDAPGANSGLFDQIGNSGTVRNLIVQNAVVTGGLAGVIAGVNEGTIENVHVSGTSTEVSGIGAAGIVGQHVQGVIRNSSANVTVNATTADAGGITSINSANIENSFSTGDVTSVNNSGAAGGITGHHITGQVLNTYATGDVTVVGAGLGAWSGAGGLIGYIFSGAGDDVINSYATGSVYGPSGLVGGLVGNNDSGENPQNSYWFDANGGDDATTCIGAGTGNCPAVSPLNLLYSQAHSVYTSGTPVWDFGSVWQENGGTYPTLQ